jgi:hypothetical protein
VKRSDRSTGRIAEAFITRRHIKAHFVFLEPVLLAPGTSSPQSIKNCVRFQRIKVEPRCIIQKFDMERRQRNASAIAEDAELTQHQMVQRARVLRHFALVSTNSGNKCMDFVNRDFNAAINNRRFDKMKTRPVEQTRANLVGQPLSLVVCMQILKPIAGGQSTSARRRRPRMGIHLPCTVVNVFLFHSGLQGGRSRHRTGNPARVTAAAIPGHIERWKHQNRSLLVRQNRSQCVNSRICVCAGLLKRTIPVP